MLDVYRFDRLLQAGGLGVTLDDVSPGFWQAVEVLRAERDRILEKRLTKKKPPPRRSGGGRRPNEEETVLEEW